MPRKHSAEMQLVSAILCKEGAKGAGKVGERERGRTDPGAGPQRQSQMFKRLVRVVAVRGAKGSEIWCTAALANQKLPRPRSEIYTSAGNRRNDQRE